MRVEAMVDALKAGEQDFEWYPTTDRMVDAVSRALTARCEKARTSRLRSVLDIGAGDGRVLTRLAVAHPNAELYSIEKAPLLAQAQPAGIIPAGTDLFEQDLMSLPVDAVFCNPRYSEFEAWTCRILETVHASWLYLVIPRRWKDSASIAAALKRRQAKVRTILQDDFLDAERRARAVVDVVEVTFAVAYSTAPDPFDLWFDEHIDTFDQAAPESASSQERRDLARLHRLDSIDSLVAAYDEDYARMQANYQALFQLDYALFKELGIDKDAVRKGLKARMAGLKHTYWTALFDHLEVITSRLSTKTRTQFRDRITRQATVAFTYDNAHAVVLWALRFANHYFDRQLVDLFRALSTHEGVSNYTSNQRTWERDGWRYTAEQFSHYRLDYRVVLRHFSAIYRPGSLGAYDSPGNLHRSCHDLIDDVTAVLGNLGLRVQDERSRTRTWQAGEWQDFHDAGGRVVFQVKGFLNGNLHFRFLPAAIKALNIEAGRLLGWLRTQEDVARELNYTAADAAQWFSANQQLVPGAVRFLGAGATPA